MCHNKTNNLKKATIVRSGETLGQLSDNFSLGHIADSDASDSVKYSFEATAVNAAVIVCKGLFKGATIRD